MDNKLLKIASAGLLLWKFYHEKKSYDAQMAQYKKANEQYQKDNDQYHEDLADYLDGKSAKTQPIADGKVEGLTFDYKLFLRYWTGDCTAARLMVTIHNRSKYTYRLSNIKVVPWINNEPSKVAATNSGITITPNAQTTLQEWNWGSYKQDSGEFTSDNLVMLEGEKWDEFKDQMHANGQTATFDGKSWYTMGNVDLVLTASVSMKAADGSGRWIEIGGYSKNLINGKFYHS